MDYNEVKKKSDDMLVQIMKYDFNELNYVTDVRALYKEMACTLITASIVFNPDDEDKTIESLDNVLHDVTFECFNRLIRTFEEGGDVDDSNTIN